jgi:hypothetical protein
MILYSLALFHLKGFEVFALSPLADTYQVTLGQIHFPKRRPFIAILSWSLSQRVVGQARSDW